MTELLEMQADRIEDILASFGIAAQVFAGQVLPQVISYQVQLGPGQRLQAIRSLHGEIAMGLGVQGVLVGQRDGAVAIEVPREFTPVHFAKLITELGAAPPSHTALLGLSNRGEPLMLYLPSPRVAHVLIAGMTGCGKTELLRTMVISLVLWGTKNMGIYLIDPKQRKLAELASLPAVLGHTGAEGAPHLLEELLVWMEARDATGSNSPRLYVVIDELADLILIGGKPIDVALTRLVQRGREAGIHLIMTTQRPSAAIVQGLMKANFPVRISGAVNSALDASIATGMAGSGAERLLGRGDMLLAHHGQLVRFQACITSDKDLTSLGQRKVRQASTVIEPIGQVLGRLRERLSIRGPGRPAEPPTKGMINFAIAELEQHGKCSQRAVRRWHKDKHGTDVHPPRAAAAITEARRRLGLRFG